MAKENQWQFRDGQLQRIPVGMAMFGFLSVFGVDLGELEFAGGVVVYGLPLGVSVQYPNAILACAVSAPTVAAEGCVCFSTGGAVVDGGYACADLRFEAFDPLALFGVDGAGKAVGRSVGVRHGFVEVLHRGEVHRGAEDFVLEKPHIWRHVIPHGGLNVETVADLAFHVSVTILFGPACAARQKLGSFFHVGLGLFEMLHESVVDAFANERTIGDFGMLQRMAHLHFGKGVHEFLFEAFGDGLVKDDVG